jgi:hypothetical protein
MLSSERNKSTPSQRPRRNHLAGRQKTGSIVASIQQRTGERWRIRRPIDERLWS